mgnify:CR=1 FL=1
MILESARPFNGAPPLGVVMREWGEVTARQSAQRLNNSYLREVIPLAFSGDVPLVLSLFSLALRHRRLAGYVISGARALVERDKAVGIRLADGTERRAD